MLLAAQVGGLYPTASSDELAVTRGFILNGLRSFIVAVGVTGYAAEAQASVRLG